MLSSVLVSPGRGSVPGTIRSALGAIDPLLVVAGVCDGSVTGCSAGAGDGALDEAQLDATDDDPDISTFVVAVAFSAGLRRFCGGSGAGTCAGGFFRFFFFFFAVAEGSSVCCCCFCDSDSLFWFAGLSSLSHKDVTV